MIRKAFYSILLPSLLLLLANCGTDQNQTLFLENSNNINENVSSIHYIYSLEKHQEVRWTHEGGFSPDSSCDTAWFLEITALLEESVILSGPLSSDQFHTANNPHHKLTVTYKDGSQKQFNLHAPSSYNHELNLSNDDEVIAFFSRYFNTNGSCNSAS